eukprot:m.277108 g.277108  ORF g.277108 m.277108 type:complete len:667 (+) comp19371_c1_seq2:158-2158(+)
MAAANAQCGAAQAGSEPRGPLRVAIVGAGPAGLAAAKAALEEGLLPTVFERQQGLGGIWLGNGPVWDSMHTNLSQFSCCFSDFPWTMFQQQPKNHSTSGGAAAGGAASGASSSASSSSSSRASTSVGARECAGTDACANPGSANQSFKGSRVSGLAKTNGDAKTVQGAVDSDAAVGTSPSTCSLSPLFPLRAELHEYLEAYAQYFGLLQHARFSTSVVSASQTDDGTGAWAVATAPAGQDPTGHDGQIGAADAATTASTARFDRLVVASGFFSAPHWPEAWPRSEASDDGFAGPVLHSQDYNKYRRRGTFHRKRVLVVGNAFSGFEIAADLVSAPTGAEVVHLVRTPKFVLPRFVPSAGTARLPVDSVFYVRQPATNVATGASPPPTPVDHAPKKQHLERTFGNPGDAHPVLHVDTNDSQTPAFVCISDGYLDAVRRGTITPVTGSVTHLSSPSQVGFADGTSHDNIDAVIVATGFETRLDYFGPAVSAGLGFVPEDQLQPLLLHETVFPGPDVRNLAFVGMYRGPYFAVIELQARWAMGVWSGRLPMPSDSTLRAGVAAEQAIRALQPRPQFPHGDYVQLADHLATLVGVLPTSKAAEGNGVRGHCGDDVVASATAAMWDSPVVPANFRLTGFAASPAVAAAEILRVADTARHHLPRRWYTVSDV